MLRLREARDKRADITIMGRVSSKNFFGIAGWLAEISPCSIAMISQFLCS